MRKMIAQKGTKASSIKRTKRAQDGTMKTLRANDPAKSFLDLSEKNPYAGKSGASSRIMSAMYEGQPYVRAKKAEEAKRAKMTPEEKEIQRINAKRIEAGVAGPRAGSKQRKGGVTKKAQAGVKAKAQMGTKTKAKYGTMAKKASSKRSK